MQQAIGIIDSGLGGLTVAREIMRQLPKEKIVYFGDTDRCPYGPRPAEEVRTFTHQMIRYLLQYHIKVLIIGCNTATAVVLDEVKQNANLPVIGVVEPGVRSAIQKTENGKIAVIGTQGTIHSGAYEKGLKRINPDISVFSHECSSLVSLVESGDLHSKKALKIVEDALIPFKGHEFDTMILGCTHYPLIAHLIQEVVGEEVTLISSAESTAREASAILSHRDMLTHSLFGNPRHCFFTSGELPTFKAIAEEWLQDRIEVEQVNLKTVSAGMTN